MLRRGSVLLGLAVLLSLLFPLKALLKESGVDPLAVQLPILDLAAACALVAVLPAMLMFRDANLEHRIPRWSAWVGLLAVCSVLFLLLHVSWSLELATSYLREAMADSTLPRGISHQVIMSAAELAARLGVLVSLVAVLVQLEAMPDEVAPGKRRRKK